MTTTIEMTNEESPARKLEDSELDAINGGIIGGNIDLPIVNAQRNPAIRGFLNGFYENCGCVQ